MKIFILSMTLQRKFHYAYTQQYLLLSLFFSGQMFVRLFVVMGDINTTITTQSNVITATGGNINASKQL